MTLLRKTLVVTGIILITLILVGFFLPRRVSVERAIVVQAPRAAVFDVLNGFGHFNKWSPWAMLDPNAKYTFDGPASGVGARMTWVGDPATMGSGAQEILASDPPARVRLRYDFGAQRAEATFDLSEQDGGTRVVCRLDVDLGNNPVGRYFGLMFDGMIGGDFERGLSGLKAYVEKSAGAAQ
jgi:uncharacterized protein YndB with AHSA1/START domain